MSKNAGEKPVNVELTEIESCSNSVCDAMFYDCSAIEFDQDKNAGNGIANSPDLSEATPPTLATPSGAITTTDNTEVPVVVENTTQNA